MRDKPQRPQRRQRQKEDAASPERSVPRDRKRKASGSPESVARPVKPSGATWMDLMDETTAGWSDTEEEKDLRQEEERKRRREEIRKKYETQKKSAPADEQPKESEKQQPVADKQQPAKAEEPKKQIGFDLFSASEDLIATNSISSHQLSQAMNTEMLNSGLDDVTNPLLHDNWTDGEGYYAFKTGEVLNKKYMIEGRFGSGVFSIVLKGRDMSSAVRKQADAEILKASDNIVAIKVVRSNETMTKSGRKELEILRCLAERDEKGKKHCVHLFESFMHRRHLCIVLEPFEGGNLREVLQKFGKRAGRVVGLSIAAVKSYARQLCTCLKHLSACGVLHADFKPDNVLVSADHQTVKLGDFGSAMFTSEVEITPYLVSRFYRPPEVILGLPYSYPMDMWALGVTTYELFTGRMMFSGEDNNAMLHLIQEVRGAIPKKLVRMASFKDKHFNDFTFQRFEIDSVTKKRVVKSKTYSQPTRTVKSLLDATVKDLSYTAEEKIQLNNLRDFIEKATMVDPSHRLTPDEALIHPFILSAAV